MSKRQPGRAKAANDFYPTPAAAVPPLLPYLRPGTRFYEPCAGAGDLVKHLVVRGRPCVGACDIDPRDPSVVRGNALMLGEDDLSEVDVFVTNPPHTHLWLAPLIEHLRRLRPTWLLLPLDWCATLQAYPHMRFCSTMVSLGRMKIYPESPSAGFDNFVWARFEAKRARTIFHGKGFRNVPTARLPQRARRNRPATDL